MFKAVVFDIGQTLVEYRIPLNWSRLYRPAFEHVAEHVFIPISDRMRLFFRRWRERCKCFLTEEYCWERCRMSRMAWIIMYALEDIAPLRRYIDYPLTSNDVGFRKPRPEGLGLLSEKMQVDISELIFVGDEQKDMRCAANAGAYAVLINRDGTVKYYGQDREIASLEELSDIVEKTESEKCPERVIKEEYMK